MRLIRSASPCLLAFALGTGGIAFAASVNAPQVNQLNVEVQRLLQLSERSSGKAPLNSAIGALARSSVTLLDCHNQTAATDAGDVPSCTTELGNLAQSWDSLALRLNEMTVAQDTLPADLEKQLLLTQNIVIGWINAANATLNASSNPPSEDSINTTRYWREHDRGDWHWRHGRDHWRWRDRDEWRWRYPVYPVYPVYPDYPGRFYRCYQDVYYRWYCPWTVMGLATRAVK